MTRRSHSQGPWVESHARMLFLLIYPGCSPGCSPWLFPGCSRLFPGCSPRACPRAVPCSPLPLTSPAFKPTPAGACGTLPVSSGFLFHFNVRAGWAGASAMRDTVQVHWAIIHSDYKSASTTMHWFYDEAGRPTSICIQWVSSSGDPEGCGQHSFQRERSVRHMARA